MWTIIAKKPCNPVVISLCMLMNCNCDIDLACLCTAVSITWEFDSYTTPESEDVMVCAKLVDQELLIGVSVFATFTANTAEGIIM